MKMILSAQSIRKREGIIQPFAEKTIYNGMSYGLTGAGYDIRIAENITVPVGKGVLASSLEHFRLPNDVQGRVCDKSSWARKMLAVQNTVLEPGWYGYLTLELTNHSDEPIIIPKGSPIAQVVFHLLDEPTELPYKGKYQAQKAGAQPAIHEAITPNEEEKKSIDKFFKDADEASVKLRHDQPVNDLTDDETKQRFLSTEENEGFHPVTGELKNSFKAYYVPMLIGKRDTSPEKYPAFFNFLKENKIGCIQSWLGRRDGFVEILNIHKQKVIDYSESLMKKHGFDKIIIDDDFDNHTTEQKL
jgi:dCTP deaminase